MMTIYREPWASWSTELGLGFLYLKIQSVQELMELDSRLEHEQYATERAWSQTREETSPEQVTQALGHRGSRFWPTDSKRELALYFRN